MIMIVSTGVSPSLAVADVDVLRRVRLLFKRNARALRAWQRLPHGVGAGVLFGGPHEHSVAPLLGKLKYVDVVQVNSMELAGRPDCVYWTQTRAVGATSAWRQRVDNVVACWLIKLIDVVVSLIAITPSGDRTAPPWGWQRMATITAGLPWTREVWAC